MIDSAIPLALYIHFPWCVAKCPYCDFNSHQLRGQLPELSYTEALCADLRAQSSYVGSREVSSIFMGGGTPSLFSANAIAEVLTCVKRYYRLSDSAEITLEANPGTFEKERFAAYQALGINRLSIGVQSFSDRLLKSLGRIHSANEAKLAIAEAMTLGFQSVNIDIMYALSQQTIDEMLADLEQVCHFNPDHISWYELTCEPKTAYYKRPPVLPSSELKDEMTDVGLSYLLSNGYERYEISAFCKPGFECLHNTNIWQFGDYLGVGAGASGKYTQSNCIYRTEKRSSPKIYQLAPCEFAKQHVVDPKSCAFEAALCALRLVDGMDWPSVLARVPSDIQTEIVDKLNQGELSPDRLQLKAEHYLHYNTVMMDLLP